MQCSRHLAGGLILRPSAEERCEEGRQEARHRKEPVRHRFSVGGRPAFSSWEAKTLKKVGVRYAGDITYFDSSSKWTKETP